MHVTNPTENSLQGKEKTVVLGAVCLCFLGLFFAEQGHVGEDFDAATVYRVGH